jgi:hypothetical protein
MKTRAEIGTTSRRKGIQAERDLAKYLRTWWPNAERKADTGWRTKDRHSADHGDIRGVPDLVFQLKYVADMSDIAIGKAISDAEDQAVAAGADYGILIQRRAGKSDPGRWWAWLRIGDLCALADKTSKVYTRTLSVHAPTRIELNALVDLLGYAGYGGAVTP